MKLTIKTLQQSTFEVDIEAEKTVKELKDRIEKDHGSNYPSGAQKLIYSGKILADESKLSEYDIDEKKFVVLMITRPPPATKPPLVDQPQFKKIQDIISQSPHLLSSTIESLAGSDPETYQLVSENPDVFVSALNQPMPSNRGQGASGTGQQSQADLAAIQQALGGQDRRRDPVVDQLIGNVSEHDKEAIERLKELGFSEYLAIQAYMACDKDEQLAANLLFQMDQ